MGKRPRRTLGRLGVEDRGRAGALATGFVAGGAMVVGPVGVCVGGAWLGVRLDVERVVDDRLVAGGRRGLQPCDRLADLRVGVRIEAAGGVATSKGAVVVEVPAEDRERGGAGGDARGLRQPNCLVDPRLVAEGEVGLGGLAVDPLVEVAVPDLRVDPRLRGISAGCAGAMPRDDPGHRADRREVGDDQRAALVVLAEVRALADGRGRRSGGADHQGRLECGRVGGRAAGVVDDRDVDLLQVLRTDAGRGDPAPAQDGREGLGLPEMVSEADARIGS